MSKIEILSIAVQIHCIHRIMFANREIFGNYYNFRVMPAGPVVAWFYACPQLKLIAFAKVDYVYLNSHDRERASERAVDAVIFPLYPKTPAGSKTRACSVSY